MGEVLFIAAQVVLLGAAWFILPRFMSKTSTKGHHALPSPLHLKSLMPGICTPLASGMPLITISEAPSPNPSKEEAGPGWLGGGGCSRRVSFHAVRPYRDSEEIETTVVRPLTPWMPNPSMADIDAAIEQEERERVADRLARGLFDDDDDDDDDEDEDEADMDMFEWDVKLSGDTGSAMEHAKPETESARIVEMLN